MQLEIKKTSTIYKAQLDELNNQSEHDFKDKGGYSSESQSISHQSFV